MDRKIIIKNQMEEIREVLNTKILKGSLSKEILKLSCDLDKLIVEYTKMELNIDKSL